MNLGGMPGPMAIFRRFTPFRNISLTMTFDVRSAAQFVALCEEMSFTRASARLGMAQPALSKRIQGLERQLGFRLLVRTTRRVELTEEGRIFLAAARPLAAALAEAGKVVRYLAGEQGAPLRIGAPPYSSRLAPRARIVAEFARRHPTVPLALEVGWTPTLLQAVRSGALAGAFGLGEPEADDLDSIELVRLQVQLRIDEADPLARAPELRAESLAGRRIVVFTRSLYPQLFDAAFAPLARAGATLIQSPEIEEARAAPANGPSADPVARFGLPAPHPVPGLRPIAGAAPVPFRFYHRPGPADPALGAFRALCLESGAEPARDLPGRGKSD